MIEIMVTKITSLIPKNTTQNSIRKTYSSEKHFTLDFIRSSVVCEVKKKNKISKTLTKESFFKNRGVVGLFYPVFFFTSITLYYT